MRSIPFPRRHQRNILLSTEGRTVRLEGPNWNQFESTTTGPPPTAFAAVLLIDRNIHVLTMRDMLRPSKFCFSCGMPNSATTNRKENRLFTDSTPLLQDFDALRARAEEDGFLFFKRFLPREEELELRADELAVVERDGWREPRQDALGGRINLDAINSVPDEAMRSDIGVSAAAYGDTQRLERMHRLPHHPRLLEFYRNLFGGEVLVHPRHIARMITGHRAVSPTPPHQDFPLIQGTAKTWTCWIPLGDCPRTMGGLTVLKGSHRHGYLPIQPSKGAGGVAVPLCPWETEWVEGDYEAGDIITFPSYTIQRYDRKLWLRKRSQVNLTGLGKENPAGRHMPAARTRKETPAMNNDGMIELAERAKDEGRSLLDGVIRQGAQKILQAALELEIEEHLAAMGVGADGRRLAVRNGRLPSREILTGAGALADRVALTGFAPVRAPTPPDVRFSASGG
jgi:hypothetical protein